jgi:hypothetical protein
VAGLEDYGFTLLERPLAALVILFNDGRLVGEIPQPPDFRNADDGLVGWVFAAFNRHRESRRNVCGPVLCDSCCIHIEPCFDGYTGPVCPGHRKLRDPVGAVAHIFGLIE